MFHKRYQHASPWKTEMLCLDAVFFAESSGLENELGDLSNSRALFLGKPLGLRRSAHGLWAADACAEFDRARSGRASPD
jgi:hypothetical protein